MAGAVQRVRISELNPHLMCVLCGGYYVDATTIIECLHSFCKTCIVRYLDSSKFCPICDVQVHKTKPLLNIRPDHTLQELVYKLVPGLYTREVLKRRQFYRQTAVTRAPSTDSDDFSSSGGEAPGKSKDPAGGKGDPTSARSDPVGPDTISVSLELSTDGQPVIRHKTKTSQRQSEEALLQRRYLMCPAAFTIGHLKKFIRMKLDISTMLEIDVFHTDEPLSDSYALMDIAYIYCWFKAAPLPLFFCVFERSPAKRPRLEITATADTKVDVKTTPKSKTKKVAKITGKRKSLSAKDDLKEKIPKCVSTDASKSGNIIHDEKHSGSREKQSPSHKSGYSTTKIVDKSDKNRTEMDTADKAKSHVKKSHKTNDVHKSEKTEVKKLSSNEQRDKSPAKAHSVSVKVASSGTSDKKTDSQTDLKHDDESVKPGESSKHKDSKHGAMDKKHRNTSKSSTGDNITHDQKDNISHKSSKHNSDTKRKKESHMKSSKSKSKHREKESHKVNTKVIDNEKPSESFKNLDKDKDVDQDSSKAVQDVPEESSTSRTYLTEANEEGKSNGCKISTSSSGKSIVVSIPKHLLERSNSEKEKKKKKKDKDHHHHKHRRKHRRQSKEGKISSKNGIESSEESVKSASTSSTYSSPVSDRGDAKNAKVDSNKTLEPGRTETKLSQREPLLAQLQEEVDKRTDAIKAEFKTKEKSQQRETNVKPKTKDVTPTKAEVVKHQAKGEKVDTVQQAVPNDNKRKESNSSQNKQKELVKVLPMSSKTNGEKPPEQTPVDKKLVEKRAQDAKSSKEGSKTNSSDKKISLESSSDKKTSTTSSNKKTVSLENSSNKLLQANSGDKKIPTTNVIEKRTSPESQISSKITLDRKKSLDKLDNKKSSRESSKERKISREGSSERKTVHITASDKPSARVTTVKKDPATVTARDKSPIKLTGSDKTHAKVAVTDKSPAKVTANDKMSARVTGSDKTAAKITANDKMPARVTPGDKTPSRVATSERAPSRANSKDRKIVNEKLSETKLREESSDRKPQQSSKVETKILESSSNFKKSLIVSKPVTPTIVKPQNAHNNNEKSSPSPGKATDVSKCMEVLKLKADKIAKNVKNSPSVSNANTLSKQISTGLTVKLGKSNNMDKVNKDKITIPEGQTVFLKAPSSKSSSSGSGANSAPKKSILSKITGPRMSMMKCKQPPKSMAIAHPVSPAIMRGTGRQGPPTDKQQCVTPPMPRPQDIQQTGRPETLKVPMPWKSLSSLAEAGKKIQESANTALGRKPVTPAGRTWVDERPKFNGLQPSPRPQPGEKGDIAVSKSPTASKEPFSAFGSPTLPKGIKTYSKKDKFTYKQQNPFGHTSPSHSYEGAFKNFLGCADDEASPPKKAKYSQDPPKVSTSESLSSPGTSSSQFLVSPIKRERPPTSPQMAAPRHVHGHKVIGQLQMVYQTIQKPAYSEVCRKSPKSPQKSLTPSADKHQGPAAPLPTPSSDKPQNEHDSEPSEKKVEDSVPNITVTEPQPNTSPKPDDEPEEIVIIDIGTDVHTPVVITESPEKSTTGNDLKPEIVSVIEEVKVTNGENPRECEVTVTSNDHSESPPVKDKPETSQASCSSTPKDAEVVSGMLQKSSDCDKNEDKPQGPTVVQSESSEDHLTTVGDKKSPESVSPKTIPASESPKHSESSSSTPLRQCPAHSPGGARSPQNNNAAPTGGSHCDQCLAAIDGLKRPPQETPLNLHKPRDESQHDSSTNTQARSENGQKNGDSEQKSDDNELKRVDLPCPIQVAMADL